MKKSPDQYIGLLIQYLCILRKIQLLSKVLEDFLKVLIVGDLQMVVVQLCPCKLVLDTLHRFAARQIAKQSTGRMNKKTSPLKSLEFADYSVL